MIAAGQAWSDDRAMRLGAGLAYYSLFALIPILTLAVSLASLFFDQQAVSAEVGEAIAAVLGEETAGLVLDAIQRTRQNESGLLAVVSVGVLVFTATFLFVAWRDVVDIMWDVPKQRGVRAMVNRRLFGLLSVLGAAAFLTMVLLVQGILGFLATRLGFGLLDPVIAFTSAISSTILGGLLIAVLFKYSPDRELRWGAVWFPAIVTTLLLALGSSAYGVYVDTFGVSSAVGVAGTLFLGLAFVYYAAQILLFGMELVKVAHLRR